ncbi:CBS domain-containing protein [Burkholderia ubonensis]|uniref:CBS domain-containing protein n=1 Tax=Burkholderia ubonensis TaxID=101571 RepID=UPI0009B30A9D|nr:CBS domain-containing protein [Burkholderia ubonensis]
MNLEALQAQLARVRATLDDGQQPDPISVRELLRWADAERRGANVVYEIRQALRRNGVDTEPNFNWPSLETEVQFRLEQPDHPAEPVVQAEAVPELIVGEANLQLPGIVLTADGRVEQPRFLGGGLTEPAFRVSRLGAANKAPRSVPPDCTLTEAMTIMLLNDFSQLPVMTGERDVKGIVSWSSIARHLQFDAEKPKLVRQCMDQSLEVKESDSLFDVVRLIASESYVLVRGEDKKIKGIVTSTDLNLQFQQLSEPFLLLGEIENFIRSLIGGKFTADELCEVRDPADAGRVVESVADLTFGEAKRLFENPGYWERIGLQLDRVTFVNELDRVRQIRNDVMHFDPDPISREDHDALRAFVHFLHQVDRLN